MFIITMQSANVQVIDHTQDHIKEINEGLF